MHTPPTIIRAKPTGRVKVRRGFLGRMVLQVEERMTSYDAFDFELQRPKATWLRWRDANWKDITDSFVRQLPEAAG